MPGAQPVLFAPGIVSGHYPPHSPPVLSPDLGTLYWASGRPPEGLVERMSMEGPRYGAYGSTARRSTRPGPGAGGIGAAVGRRAPSEEVDERRGVAAVVVAAEVICSERSMVMTMMLGGGSGTPTHDPPARASAHARPEPSVLQDTAPTTWMNPWVRPPSPR